MPRRHPPTVLLVLATAGTLPAQAAADLTAAEQRVAAYHDRIRAFDPVCEWTDDGTALTFVIARNGERRHVRIDLATGERREDGDPKALGLDGEGRRLAPQAAGVRTRGNGAATQVTFYNRTDRQLRLLWIDADGIAHDYGLLAPFGVLAQDTYVGHAWRLDTHGGEVVAAFVAAGASSIAEVDATAEQRARSMPRRYRELAARDARVFVKDHDLWLRSGDAAAPVVLADDGSADDAYRSVHVSPTGAHALAFQVVPEQDHELVLVESRPHDQVQPRVHTLQYLKPGDRIAVPRPRLFDLRTRTRIAVDAAPFADAWSIDAVHWHRDGREVHLLYNRRGHQQLAVLAIDAATGAVRTVVAEHSDTFVDYSQKTMLHWLDRTGELLWASERDGHNHLYRVDVATGAIAPVTTGAWNVRSIEHVDEDTREVWVAALGFHADQDPYHRHLLRVPLDGGAPVAITRSDGEHEWELSPDRRHAVVRWSRVDHPRVIELRRCSDGALVAELGRDDWAPLLQQGFAPAQRFVAKGRDGATDIFGLVLRPSFVDPAKRYPVLEAIYAGPHDYHVPKAFDLQLSLRALAELGFVVVQIDGMGTNWRSKAFHDVCWRNLKDAGFLDRKAWLRALGERHPEVDLSRVGIFGGSAGGQNALAALLWHSDLYRAAAADCGCHDNRMDKLWWNEAWMGYPVGPWYAENSNVEHARLLQGKLLLTVGELDRNVDPSSTLQVVHALLQADKDFEFVLVPGGGHGCGEMPGLARRRAEFFVRHLGGPR